MELDGKKTPSSGPAYREVSAIATGATARVTQRAARLRFSIFLSYQFLQFELVWPDTFVWNRTNRGSDVEDDAGVSKCDFGPRGDFGGFDFLEIAIDGNVGSVRRSEIVNCVDPVRF